MKRRPGAAPPDWEGWQEYRHAAKKPPPEHGIKVKKVGTTWWGQRWIEALEHVLSGDASRLGRGRTYARAGRVHDLSVRAGKVVARVTGTRPAPYEVTIELLQLSEAAWQRAIGGMAEQAQFSAELLAGEMPRAIDDVFRAAGNSVFPEQRADLTTHCSCPDWGDPCKHVAATHYVLGEAFDQDPFLLFELRGRTKAEVLEALRRARAGDLSEAEAPPPTVTLGTLDGADYDRARSALPPLQFSFDAPQAPGAVLRQLGAPATWRADASPAEALAPLVQRAAEAARRIALAEPVPEAGEEAPDPRRSRRPAQAKPSTREAPRAKAKPRPRATPRTTKALPRAEATPRTKVAPTKPKPSFRRSSRRGGS